MKSKSIATGIVLAFLLVSFFPFNALLTNAESSIYPPQISIASQNINLVQGYNSTIQFTIYNANNIDKEVDYTLSDVPSYMTVDVNFYPSTLVPSHSTIYGTLTVHLSSDAPSTLSSLDFGFQVFWKDERAVSESITLTIVISATYKVEFYADSNPYEFTPYKQTDTDDFTPLQEVEFNEDGLGFSPLHIKSHSNVVTVNFFSVEVSDDPDNYIATSNVKNAMILSAEDNALGSIVNDRAVPFTFSLKSMDFPEGYQFTLTFTVKTYDASSFLTLNQYPDEDTLTEPTDINPKFTTSYSLTIILHQINQIPTTYDFELIYISATTSNGETSDNIITAEPSDTITIKFNVHNKCNSEIKIDLTWFLYEAKDDLTTSDRTSSGLYNLSNIRIGDTVSSQFNPADYQPSGNYIEVSDDWIGSGIYEPSQTQKQKVYSITLEPYGTKTLFLDLYAPSYAQPNSQYILKIIGIIAISGQTRSLEVGLVNSDNFIAPEEITNENAELSKSSEIMWWQTIALITVVTIAIITVYYFHSKVNPKKHIKKIKKL